MTCSYAVALVVHGDLVLGGVADEPLVVGERASLRLHSKFPSKPTLFGHCSPCHRLW